MTNCQPREVLFEFSRSGVIAHTYHGQGSDFGLSGGLLGYDTDDSRIVPSLDEAKEKGIDISFSVVDEPFETVSLYRIKAKGGGRTIETEIDSLGGGMIEIIRFNGIPVSVGGGFYESFLLLKPCSAHEALSLLALVISRLPDYATAVLCENEKAERLINLKSERPLDPTLLSDIPVIDVIHLDPVLPIPSLIRYPDLFHTAAEIEQMADADSSLTLADIAIKYESLRSGLSASAVTEKMKKIVSTLTTTIAQADSQTEEYPDRILPRQAYLLDNAPQVPGDAYHMVTKYITLLMEAKSSMRTIVAAPTGGSCGGRRNTFGPGNLFETFSERNCPGYVSRWHDRCFNRYPQYV